MLWAPDSTGHYAQVSEHPAGQTAASRLLPGFTVEVAAVFAAGRPV